MSSSSGEINGEIADMGMDFDETPGLSFKNLNLIFGRK